MERWATAEKEKQRLLKKAKKINAILFTHKHRYGVREDTVSNTTDKIEQNGTEMEK